VTKGQLSGRLPRVGPGIFAALALYAIGLGVVYGLTDDERSGLVLLLLAGVASGGFATWLYLFGRETSEDGSVAPEPPEAGDPAPYLPTTSLAPLLLGGGATLAVAGVPLGLWVLLPGLVLLGWGVTAFARQSRDRD
jgi:hypothetical protein